MHVLVSIRMSQACLFTFEMQRHRSIGDRWIFGAKIQMIKAGSYELPEMLPVAETMNFRDQVARR